MNVLPEAAPAAIPRPAFARQQRSLPKPGAIAKRRQSQGPGGGTQGRQSPPHPIPNSADPPIRRTVRSFCGSGQRKPFGKYRALAIRRCTSHASRHHPAPRPAHPRRRAWDPMRPAKSRTRAPAPESVMAAQRKARAEDGADASGTRISRISPAPRSRAHSSAATVAKPVAMKVAGGGQRTLR